MAVVEWCECCDLPIESCGRAAEAKQRAELQEWRRWLVRHGWFRSNYPRVCHRCETGFKAGSVIRSDGFTSRGGVYVGECCAPEMP